MGKKAGFHLVKPGSSPGIATMAGVGHQADLISLLRRFQYLIGHHSCAPAQVSRRVSYICAARLDTVVAQGKRRSFAGYVGRIREMVLGSDC